jgi:hypothetical protein
MDAIRIIVIVEVRLQFGEADSDLKQMGLSRHPAFSLDLPTARLFFYAVLRKSVGFRKTTSDSSPT